MEYTIKELAELSGVSTRTLRYYDGLDLLKPAFIRENGYRIYTSQEADVLWQILLYRELGLELSVIKEILYDPKYNRLYALEEHFIRLNRQKEHLEQLIATVEKTIKQEKGGIRMEDKEKFQSFKKELVEKNETAYGVEIREKYGDEAVDESNRKMMNLTKEQYDNMQQLAEEILEKLELAVNMGENPSSPEGQKIAALHREWLGYTWKSYSKEAHRGLAVMYVEDERFRKYYDKKTDGCAEFLKNAVWAYTDEM